MCLEADRRDVVGGDTERSAEYKEIQCEAKHRAVQSTAILAPPRGVSKQSDKASTLSEGNFEVSKPNHS